MGGTVSVSALAHEAHKVGKAFGVGAHVALGKLYIPSVRHPAGLARNRPVIVGLCIGEYVAIDGRAHAARFDDAHELTDGRNTPATTIGGVASGKRLGIVPRQPLCLPGAGIGFPSLAYATALPFQIGLFVQYDRACVTVGVVVGRRLNLGLVERAALRVDVKRGNERQHTDGDKNPGSKNITEGGGGIAPHHSANALCHARLPEFAFVIIDAPSVLTQTNQRNELASVDNPTLRI